MMRMSRNFSWMVVVMKSVLISHADNGYACNGATTDSRLTPRPRTRPPTARPKPKACHIVLEVTDIASKTPTPTFIVHVL